MDLTNILNASNISLLIMVLIVLSIISFILSKLLFLKVLFKLIFGVATFALVCVCVAWIGYCIGPQIISYLQDLL